MRLSVIEVAGAYLPSGSGEREAASRWPLDASRALGGEVRDGDTQLSDGAAGLGIGIQSPSLADAALEVAELAATGDMLLLVRLPTVQEVLQPNPGALAGRPDVDPLAVLVWRDHQLKPWRVEAFKISNNLDFEEKLVDVVGLYMDPPEKAVVFLLRREDPVSGVGPDPAVAADGAWAGRHDDS